MEKIVMLYTDEQLVKLREILLMMMDEIKRVCDENGLHYFCMYGTLIGAVRHKGYIPWDDDFDIGMLRPDYEEFMRIADSRMRSDMFVENYDSCEGYGHVFGKVMLRGTIWQENFTEYVDCFKHVYIDIFPIDRTTKNIILQKKQFTKLKALARMLLLNRKYKYSKTGLKKLAYKTGYWFSGLFTKDALVQEWKKTAFQYSSCSDGIYVNLAGVYPLCKEMFLQEELEGFIETEFEDRNYAIPQNYDSILRRCYGDYRKLPPKENQVAHHNIVKIDFGTY